MEFKNVLTTFGFENNAGWFNEFLNDQKLWKDVDGWLESDASIALWAITRSLNNGIIIEIGTYCGRSTTILSTSAKKNGSTVISIDHHIGSIEHAHKGNKYFRESIGRAFTLPIFSDTFDNKRLFENVIPIVTTSEKAHNLIGSSFEEEKKKLDFVFVDGDHSYEGCLMDLTLWANLIKKEGFIAVHDSTRPDIERAIKEKLTSNEWKQIGIFGSLYVATRRTANVENS